MVEHRLLVEPTHQVGILGAQIVHHAAQAPFDAEPGQDITTSPAAMTTMSSPWTPSVRMSAWAPPSTT